MNPLEKLLFELLGQLLPYVEPPPPSACSCHVNPPCGDCVDNGHLRGLLENIDGLFKEHGVSR